MNHKKLFNQFPPVTTKEWMDKLTADLKGADFNKKLVWKTNEGFSVMPFYRREDLAGIDHILTREPRKLRGNGPEADMEIDNTQGNRWLVRQDILVDDYKAANRKALEVLQKGVESLGFIISEPESINKSNFRDLLSEIDLQCVELNFSSNGMAKEIISLLAEISEAGGYDLTKIYGAVEADPLGRLMMNGTLCIPVEAGFDYLTSLTKETGILPGYRNIQVHGSNFTNTGADCVQELGYSLAIAVEYLSVLTSRDISADEAAKRIRFSFGTGQDYFMEIAKLRAARILWSVIAGAYEPADMNSWKMEIHSSTSKWNSTVYDPYVNMLRTQTEAMSAVLGGTDSLTVNGFDSAFRESNEFSERIARNQQLILREEAYFGKVADPSAGSYYIENLTSLVAGNSWELFLEIEKEGGFLSALRSGIIQKKIAASAQKRKTDISMRREILTGSNRYPDLNERIGSATDARTFRESSSADRKPEVEPVRFMRGSEELEQIRGIVENAEKQPSVFLLKIGNHVIRKARAQFCSGFFGCAGYRIIENDGFETAGEAVEAAIFSGSGIVVICSSDEEYPVFAPQIHDGLSGKAVVVIAGNPENIEFLRSKGLENFIHIRSDLVETLKFYNSEIGL